MRPSWASCPGALLFRTCKVWAELCSRCYARSHSQCWVGEQAWSCFDYFLGTVYCTHNIALYILSKQGPGVRRSSLSFVPFHCFVLLPLPTSRLAAPQTRAIRERALRVRLRQPKLVLDWNPSRLLSTPPPPPPLSLEPHNNPTPREEEKDREG
ncbi:hypothetical protein GGR52DRAFT_468534 [Hypoxylon sp. FL1284]|nr:hypothetical protein GGR52DRAFT_468534 [Hypoxylon sp. FL1284]